MVRVPIAPEWDFPERRSDAQLESDRQRVRHQVDALSSPERYRRTRGVVEQIRGRQDRAPKQHALPFDVYQPPRTGDTESFLMTARGELVVQFEAPNGPRDPDDDVAAGKAVRREAEVLALLGELGYQPRPDDPETSRRPSQDQRARVFHSRKPPAQLAKDVELLRSRGVAAALNLVVPLGYLIKSDDFPTGTTGLGRPPTGGQATRQVRVAVVDTGFTPSPRGDGWLSNVVAAPRDLDLLDVVPEIGRLDWFSGHGTFAAGIVAQTAPLCEIVVYRFTQSDGLGTEKDLADALLQAAREGHEANVPTIINASVGTPVVPGMPLIALQNAVERIAVDYPDVLIIASAGNTGTDEPMYPAAFDGVIAVGAVEFTGPTGQDARPAPFSNFGGWVRCSTAGVGVVSTFVEGTEPPEPLAPQYPDEEFGPDAVAMWSGTSFSAPQISGAVAKLCYEDPALTPRAALDALLAGQPELAGYGRVVRLLPGTPLP